MMRGCGFEREKREWKKVIMDAGFSSYTIMPLLGPVSIKLFMFFHEESAGMSEREVTLYFPMWKLA
jgi:hypothetical protein